MCRLIPDTHIYSHTHSHAHTQFIINIYDEGEGQVCTCCRNCEGVRYVPGAAIFARCTVGDGGNALLSVKTALAPKKAKPGKLLRYRVTLRNLAKKDAITSIAFKMQMPQGFTSFEALPASNYVPKTVHGDKVRYTKAKLHPSVNATDNSVTWSGLNFPARKAIKLAVKARVPAGLSLGDYLVFSGYAYQVLPANGLPYCESAYSNQTVRIISKH